MGRKQSPNNTIVRPSPGASASNGNGGYADRNINKCLEVDEIEHVVKSRDSMQERSASEEKSPDLLPGVDARTELQRAGAHEDFEHKILPVPYIYIRCHFKPASPNQEGVDIPTAVAPQLPIAAATRSAPHMNQDGMIKTVSIMLPTSEHGSDSDDDSPGGMGGDISRQIGAVNLAHPSSASVLTTHSVLSPMSPTVTSVTSASVTVVPRVSEDVRGSIGRLFGSGAGTARHGVVFTIIPHTHPSADAIQKEEPMDVKEALSDAYMSMRRKSDQDRQKQEQSANQEKSDP